MSRAALNTVTNRAARDIWGEGITLALSGGPAASVRAVFDAAHERVEFDSAGVPVTATRPVLDVRLADLSIAPRQGDVATIGGVAHEVTEVATDGNGGAKLFLVRS